MLIRALSLVQVIHNFDRWQLLEVILVSDPALIDFVFVIIRILSMLKPMLVLELSQPPQFFLSYLPIRQLPAQLFNLTQLLSILILLALLFLSLGHLVLLHTFL